MGKECCDNCWWYYYGTGNLNCKNENASQEDKDNDGFGCVWFEEKWKPNRTDEYTLYQNMWN